MAAQISFNPVLTTNASGSFNIQSEGYFQGTALNDPAVRNALAGGVLATTETLPMWGGVGIAEFVPGTSPNPALGGNIKRATSLTGATALTGFSVFDQVHSMTTTPQSPVPLAGSSMSVNFYRLGSGARLALKAAPGLIALDGGIITQQVSWDFVGQQLVPYSPTYAANTITGAVWASTSGGRTTFTVSTDPTTLLDAGDVINVSGVVSTGGTGVGFNGAFVVVSTTSTTIVVTQAAASSPGTYSSGGSVAAGGGALACKVLEVALGNSMTVLYDAVTGFATWDRSGTTVVIQI
jgi:hypothetical protein